MNHRWSGLRELEPGLKEKTCERCNLRMVWGQRKRGVGLAIKHYVDRTGVTRWLAPLCDALNVIPDWAEEEARPDLRAVASRSITVSEAGRLGGIATRDAHGQAFYKRIGRKGGQTVKRLVAAGRRAEKP